MRTRDAHLSSQRLADTRRSQNKAGASGRARLLGRARRSPRTRAPPASPATLPEGLALGGARVPSARVPSARRAPHLACARREPAVLQAPNIQRDAPRTDGGDMGRAMVARLGLGLLLLALLLPTQECLRAPSALHKERRQSASGSAAHAHPPPSELAWGSRGSSGYPVLS
uniref:signal transducer CD24 isoform X2 n=1 Tax=Callithrix jacchus TaxID=9483 RepID=UPI00159DC0E0|nr:signal transducer CD24 isoform X2 [Callithrix jacchus]